MAGLVPATHALRTATPKKGISGPGPGMTWCKPDMTGDGEMLLLISWANRG
jgi:hypothetical protein